MLRQIVTTHPQRDSVERALNQKAPLFMRGVVLRSAVLLAQC